MLENPIILLRRAFSLYWDKISMLAPLAFIVFVVGLIQVFSVQSGSLGLSVISSIAAVIVAYVSYLAMMRAVSSPVNLHIGEIFMSVERYIVPSALVSGLIVLVVFGASLLLIIPGIIVSIFLLFSLFAVIIDHYEKRDALAYSWHLVRGRWWAVFLRFLVANIIISLCVGLVSLLLWILGLNDSSARNIIVGTQAIDQNLSAGQIIASQAINAFFTTPITLCFMYVFYEALKKTVSSPLEGEERARVDRYVRTFALIGIAFLVVSILASSFFLVKLLPEFVKVTHLPAAAFSAF